MAILALVWIIAVLFMALGLPALELTFGIILLCPLLAYPLGLVMPLTPAIYFYLLGLTAGVLALRQIRGFRLNTRPALLEFPTKEAYLPILFFSFLFLVCYGLTHAWPDFIAIGERLRDYALLSSVIDSPIALKEPWFAGYELNYYAYWYRLGHFFSIVCRLPDWEVYHSLQAFTFALFGTTIFYLARTVLQFTFVGAAVSAFIIGFGSNIAGVISFFTKDDNWWGPSRVIKGGIDEFPAWSFLLGDLHPHYLNLPLTPFLMILFLWLLSARLTLLTAAASILSFGALSALWTYSANAWELPAVLAFLGWGILISVVSWLRERKFKFTRADFKLNRTGLISAACFLILAYLCFLSSRNVVPGDTPVRLVTPPIARTQILELLAHWGFPLGLIIISLCAAFRRPELKIIAPLTVAITFIYGDALPLLLVILLINLTRLWESAPRTRTEIIMEALGFAGLTLIIFPELYFFDDAYGADIERMNTIFKFYAAAWFMIHFYAFYLCARYLAPLLRPVNRQPFKTIWQLGALVLLLGFFGRTIPLRLNNAPISPPKTEGLSTVESLHPGSAVIIRALRSLPAGVVLEAQGPAYNYTSFVSTLAGQLSYLGWANHINLLIRAYGEVSRREEVTRKIYSGLPCAEMNAVLKQEGISYVVCGTLEQRNYPDLGNADFSCLKLLATDRDYRLYSAS